MRLEMKVDLAREASPNTRISLSLSHLKHIDGGISELMSSAIMGWSRVQRDCEQEQGHLLDMVNICTQSN